MVFVFIVALLIRSVFIFQLTHTVFYDNFILDEALYNSWAREIAAGNCLGNGVFDALPLYPYILGGLYKLFGASVLVPRILNILFDSCSVLLLYHIAKRLFNKGSAIIAASIAALYGPFIFYSGLLVPATMAIFLYLVSLWTAVKLIEKPSFSRALLAGAVVAISSLAMAGILLFVPVLIAWHIGTRDNKRRALFEGAALVLAAAAVLIPVGVRNYMISGEKVLLTSHAGLNFYIGNNEDADGTFNPPQWARTNIGGLKADAKTLAEQKTGQCLSDPEVSRFYRGKAMSFIREEPLQFIKLIGRKLFLFLNAQELFDVGHYAVYAEHIPLLRIPFLSFLLIGPLGLAGAFMALPFFKRIAPLYLFSASYAVSVLLYFVNSRYRLAFAMMMVIFAGFFIASLAQKARNKRYAQLIGTVCLCLFLAFVVNLSTGIDTFATGYNNLGSLYMEAGRQDDAIEAYKKAITHDASDPKAYNDIGYLLLQKNNVEEAELWLEKALLKDPSYPYAHINRGLAYEYRDNYLFAERQYLEAIRLNPNIPQAHNNLATVYEKTNRRQSAVAEYQRALELDPDNALTHYNLGVVYGRQGMFAEAKKEFESALRIAPDFAPARNALAYCQ